LKDVTLREYYMLAGDNAAQGERAGRWGTEWDCQCTARSGNAPKSVWADIPRIPLFRGRRNEFMAPNMTATRNLREIYLHW
jgi:hypothetical protein